MIRQVISGGQTGIDQLGLKVARALGFLTGGTAPKDFRTETGSNYELRDVYHLKEHTQYDYAPRTGVNVYDADGTIILGDTSSTGSKLTERLCKLHQKPYKINPTLDEFQSWVTENRIIILNVAGNRESKMTPKQMETYRVWLVEALSLVKS